MKVGSLFSGIGGLDTALEALGYDVTWQVENDEFCNKVLEKHWDGVKRYTDIKELDPSELEKVDLICGGFPCQPVSIAGRRKGNKDPRWLWPEMYAICRVVRPRWILGENVPGLLQGGQDSGGLCTVIRDLAQIGYRVEWDCLPARPFGARHWRERVFITARLLADSDRKGLEGIYEAGGGVDLQSIARDLRGVWLSEPDVDRVAYGIPDGVDGLGDQEDPQERETSLFG